MRIHTEWQVHCIFVSQNALMWNLKKNRPHRNDGHIHHSDSILIKRIFIHQHPWVRHWYPFFFSRRKSFSLFARFDVWPHWKSRFTSTAILNLFSISTFNGDISKSFHWIILYNSGTLTHTHTHPYTGDDDQEKKKKKKWFQKYIIHMIL